MLHRSHPKPAAARIVAAMPLRSAWLLPLPGLLVAAFCTWCGAHLLSSLLIAAPLLAVAALPNGWWRGWGGRLAVLAVLPAAAALLVLQALPLLRAYPSALVPWPTLLHGWCLAGLLLLVGAGAWRAARRRGRWPVRVAGGLAALALALVVVALLGPLAQLYRPHLSAPDAAKVQTLATTRDLEIAGSAGVRLAARLYLPRTPPADGAPYRGVVVFTHGVGGWKEGFLNHHWLFLHAGWAVLSYDLRGHGRSSPAAVTFGAHEAADLAAVWRCARGLAAGRPLVAYGASMGAAITLDAAADLPGCRGLIIESPFADLGGMLRAALPAPLQAVARGLAWATGWDPDAQRPVAAPVLRAGPPLLLGWIADDPTIPAAESVAVAAACRRARTVVMAHGAHLDLIIDEAWRTAVIRFLDSPEVGQSGGPEVQ